VITISYLSGLTSTIRLGISTLVLPRRHPILVAKQLASLDYLTKGRVMVSFGAGIAGKEFNYMNQEISNRGERFNEGLEVIKHLWAGKTTFQGKFYSFEDADFRPLPHSDIPIWIAGNSIPALKRAIKYGSGWHPVRVKNRFGPKEFKTMITPYKDKLPKEFTIAVRHTLSDVVELSSTIEAYEENNIQQLLLKIPGENDYFQEVLETISSYV
ncbi:MAG: LLM class flavin-dependent oxidoreductase, partial [Candidatus Hermodarchaeota archaeon]